jgi:hypothetical protein
MFDKERIVSSFVYFISMFSTLYFALYHQNTFGAMLAVIAQFAAALWYGASFVPFMQSCLASTASSVLPL